MNFHYASGAMGYHGEGWFWHRFFNFPKLPFVTKTITWSPKKGLPFAVLPIGDSVYNKVSLHNKGILDWIFNHLPLVDGKCTLSIFGPDYMSGSIIEELENDERIEAFELNFSCPNVIEDDVYYGSSSILSSSKPIYLKLNHTQNPFDYNLDKIAGIRVNSIPLGFCGGSGKVAQKKNWEFIKRYNKEGLNVSGCSFHSFDDIRRLEDMGCKEVSIGSVIITHPKFVERILY